MTALARRNALRLGLRAETKAALFLRLKGYRILDRRLKSHVGEVDLVALRGNDLVFVEVKARATLDEAAESIRHTQRARILRAAQAYLSRRPHFVNHTLRFDAVLVAPRRFPRHIMSAFDAS